MEGLAVKLQTAFLGCVKSWITQQPIEVALRVIFSSIRLKIMVGAISDGLGGVTAEKLVADVKKAVNEAAAHHRLIRIASRLLPLVDICIENVSITVLSPGGGVLLQVVGAGRLVSLSWRVPGPHPDDTDVTHPHLLLNCFSDRALELHVPTGPDSKPAALFVSRLTGAVNLWPLLQPLMQPDTAPSLPGTTQSTAISLAVLECAEVRAVNVSSAWRLGLFSALSGGPPPLPKTSDGFCGACALAHTFLSGFHSVGVHILVQRVALEDVVGGVESLPPTVFRPNTLSPTVAECMDSMRVQIAVAEVSQLGLRASLAAEASYMFMGTAEIKAESAALTVNGSPLVLVAKPSVRVEKTLVYEPLAVLPAPLKFARSTSSLMDRPIPNSLTVHADVGSVEASVSNVVFGIATWAAYVALQFRSVTPAPNVPARGPVAQIGPPKVYLTVGAVVIRSLARNDALIGTLSIKSVTVRPTTTQVIPDKRHKLMMLDHRQQHRVWLKTICVTLPSNTAVTHLHAADGTKYTLPSLSPNQSVEAMIIHSVSLQIIPKAAAQRSDPHRITFTTEVARIIPVFDVSVDGVVLSWSERLFHCIGVLISDGLLRTRPLLAVIRHCRGNEPPASVCPSPPHSLKVHLPSAPGVLGEEKEEETLLHSEESSVPFHDQRHVPCFSSPLSGHTRSRRPDCPTTSQHPLPPRSFEAVFGERLGSIPDLGLGPDVFDVHGSPVMRPDRMVRTASRDHGEVILRIPTSPPLDPLNQSSLGSASFGMSRGVGGVITNIRVRVHQLLRLDLVFHVFAALQVMFPFELAAPEEDPSSPILRVPMVHEFTVSTADFSAHPPSGQWGLRLHHIEAFARKAPPPTSAVPPRLSSRVSVSDFGGLRDRRPSSAPPMPPPSPATPVQFDDGAKYLDLQNFAVEECPVHVPSLEPGVEFNTSIIDIFGHGE